MVNCLKDIFVLISTICVSCVNSSGSAGASAPSSKPDITGRYETEGGDYYEFDCSDEAKEKCKKMYELMSEGHDNTGHEGIFDGAASYQYVTTKNGGLYVNFTPFMPFTINGTKVEFDDGNHTYVTMSESYDSLIDVTGRTYTKVEAE